MSMRIRCPDPSHRGTGKHRTCSGRPGNLPPGGAGHLQNTAPQDDAPRPPGRIGPRRRDFAAPPGGPLRRNAAVLVRQPAQACTARTSPCPTAQGATP
ncbi:hypothetical protein [Streptomyces sp. NPDC054765]